MKRSERDYEIKKAEEEIKRIIEEEGLVPYTAAFHRGYLSPRWVKRFGPYKGKYGEGLKVEYQTSESNFYHRVVYYVKDTKVSNR